MAVEFYKTPEQQYELVFDYAEVLNPGEVIRDCAVYVNGVHSSGTFEYRNDEYLAASGAISENTIFAFDPVRYDDDTILLRVSSGVLNSGYNVDVKAISNRRIEYSKSITVYNDDISYSNVYGDFEYRYLVDGKDIYVLPTLYVDEQYGFMYNTEYTVTVDPNITSVHGLQMCLGQGYTFWFTSKYCPMFTTAANIILLLGPEAEKFTEDTINRYIHRTSKEAIDLMNLSPTCNGPKYSYDYYGCTPEHVPYNLRRYVECKTAYDLLNLLDRLRKIGGSAGGQTKTLGDMTIKYDGDSAANSGSTMDPKKDLYDCWMGLQGILSNSPTPCGTGAGINNAVRGKYDTSKGFPHPTFDGNHNRVVKPKPNAWGPWDNTTNFRYPPTSLTRRPRRGF